MQLFPHFQTSKVSELLQIQFQVSRLAGMKTIFSTFVPACSRLSLSGEDQEGAGRLAGSGREKGEVMIKYTLSCVYQRSSPLLDSLVQVTHFKTCKTGKITIQDIFPHSFHISRLASLVTNQDQSRHVSTFLDFRISRLPRLVTKLWKTFQQFHTSTVSNFSFYSFHSNDAFYALLLRVKAILNKKRNYRHNPIYDCIMKHASSVVPLPLNTWIKSVA